MTLFMQLRMSRSHSRESEGSHKSDATYSHSRSPSNEKGSPKSRDSRSKSRSKSPYRRSSRRYSGSRSRSRSHSRGHKRYLIMLCSTILSYDVVASDFSNPLQYSQTPLNPKIFSIIPAFLLYNASLYRNIYEHNENKKSQNILYCKLHEGVQLMTK